MINGLDPQKKLYGLRCWKKADDIYDTLPVPDKAYGLNPSVRQFLIDMGVVKFELIEYQPRGGQPLVVDLQTFGELSHVSDETYVQDNMDDFVRPISVAIAQSAAETLDKEILAKSEQYKKVERKANYIDFYEGIRKRICPNGWEHKFSLMETGDAFSIESKDHASNFIEEIWAIVLGPAQLEFKLVYCFDDGTKTTRSFVYSGRYAIGWVNE